MKRIGSLLFPSLTVLLLVGAFAFGVFVHDLKAHSPYMRQSLRPEQGWAIEAESGDRIQVPGHSSPHAMTVDDSNDFGFPDALSSDSPIATFQQVYQLLHDQYVEGVPSDTPLAYGAAQAMLAALDEPNSRFIEPEEHSALDQQDRGVYPGTGLAFTVRKVTANGLDERLITVIDALPGTPAQKAGLQTGDVITAIDGAWVISYDPFAADAKLFKSLEHDEVSLDKAFDATEKRLDEGITLPKAQTALDVTQTKPLVLTIQRPGQAKTFDVTLDCSKPTTIKSVDYQTLAGGQGYIHMTDFDDTTAGQFDDALAALASTKGLVIDLRDCAGGELSPAIAIGHALASTADFGRIAVRDSHSKVDDSGLGFPSKVQILRPGDEGSQVLKNSYHGNIVVLVDKGTANTAEMLASFLHDSVGARIAGTSTFGDGMAQTLFPLSDGSAFTLTTGQLQTDLGTPFEMSGITPDVAVPDASIQPVATDSLVATAESLLTMPPLKIVAKSPPPDSTSSQATLSL